MDIAAIIFAIVLVGLFAAGWHFSNQVIKPKTYTREYLYEIESDAKKFDRQAYESWEREEVAIRSPNGYELKGYYFPVEGSRKTVIICHGITANLSLAIKYMDLYRDRGFNILIYDHRNHGMSGGKNTTFGFYEKFDLKAWVDWVKEKCGEDCIIVTHGESMGAGIILQHLAIDDRVSVTVADCGFSDLQTLLAFRLKADYHLPAFPLLNVTNFIVWMRTGMRFQEVSPIRAIAGSSQPILFAHGMLDTFVPTFMSVEMYEQKPETRRLYLAPGAAHVESYWKNHEAYGQAVAAFLAEALGEKV
ncbi:MAG TPA: alpha/beta hydrolase [Anaerolineaceae bacterium]|nr:alpha/beta hydrolase [Anaerolineaceae bacterium]